MIEKEYYMWFSSITNIELSEKFKLISYFKTPYEIYKAGEDLIGASGVTPNAQKKILESRKKFNLSQMENKMYKNNVNYVYINEKNYPERLKNIYNAPFGLFYIGKLPKDDMPSVAIIGARNCSGYGRTITYKFGSELAAAGVQLVSGLAMGIDGYSHESALSAGGYTCGVLGNGIDDIYPKQNYNLFLEMYEKGGVISEYYIGTPGLKNHFPERNRLIAGLSDCLIVVEAKKKSGTMITVDRALEQGKDVFVVPGRIGDELSLGCLEMAKQGAELVLATDEILEYLSKRYPDMMLCGTDENNQYILITDKLSDISKKNDTLNKISLENEEILVYAFLNFSPKHVDEIIIGTGIDYFSVINALDGLKKKKMIIEVSSEFYTRK